MTNRTEVYSFHTNDWSLFFLSLSLEAFFLLDPTTSTNMTSHQRSIHFNITS